MNEKSQIDIITIARRIWKRKWLFVKVSVIVFIVSCAIILPVPRYYRSDVSLAPELGDVMANSRLSSVASSLGFNLGNNFNGDAISPDLYPQLMQSNDFVASLLNCRVKTLDGRVDTTYYKYLCNYQKHNPLGVPFSAIKSLFSKKSKTTVDKKPNPFQLTEDEDGIFNKIKGNINCSIELKTGVINISVTDQDPLVAATMADSVMSHLQASITRYRTNKANHDLAYYKKLTAEAKAIYEKARQTYSSYADANMDVMLESYNSKKDDLENDMQLKFNTYSALNNQLQAARARVQETTPAFTVVKSASVPLLPAGPKRMAFVFVMLVLGCLATTVYVCKDLFAALFSSKKKETTPKAE